MNIAQTTTHLAARIALPIAGDNIHTSIHTRYSQAMPAMLGMCHNPCRLLTPFLMPK